MRRFHTGIVCLVIGTAYMFGAHTTPSDFWAMALGINASLWILGSLYFSTEIT